MSAFTTSEEITVVHPLFKRIKGGASGTSEQGLMRLYHCKLTINPDGWYTSQSIEEPEAISQGENKETAKRNLLEALSLVLEDQGIDPSNIALMET